MGLFNTGSSLKWFDKAIHVVLRHEDYKYDTNPTVDRDPKDSGGTTKFGIDQRSHPNENIPALTLGRAIAIYRSEYPVIFDSIKRFHIACRVFDLGVLCGYGTATKFIQRASNRLGHKLVVDGGFGPKTLAAVNACDWVKLYDALLTEGEIYFRRIVAVNPKNSKFLKGWLNRLKDRVEFKVWTPADEAANR